MRNKFTKLKALMTSAALLAGGITSVAVGQTTYTFTNAGATGRFGPNQTQINTAYAATNLNGLVTSSLGVQSWTVPVSGLYQIDVRGAQGGGINNGGLGARMVGNFNLTQGQVLRIVVGQQGVDGTGGSAANNGGGGGGGSFVLDLSNTFTIIAGGGGGGMPSKPGGNGLTGTNGGSTYQNGGGTGGNGGNEGVADGPAAGGGG